MTASKRIKALEEQFEARFAALSKKIEGCATTDVTDKLRSDVSRAHGAATDAAQAAETVRADAAKAADKAVKAFRSEIADVKADVGRHEQAISALSVTPAPAPAEEPEVTPATPIRARARKTTA